MIGSLIGPYRVTRRLGEGGMGAVYEAVNESMERRVAIKVLKSEYANQPDTIVRFFNEARAVNRVNHPSIVQIHEQGHLPDGTAYIIMELLDGETLAARIAEEGGQLPLPTALEIGWQVAEAVAAAHSKNIVHRDLKPSNLMLVKDPLGPGGERVKVLDFGIAKLLADARQNKTASQVVMGTPTYMSPEQCRGAGGVDEKSDVYSLGAILFQMIAGRPPFVAEGLGEIVGMHLFMQPPSLRAIRSEVPAEIAAFVHRLLDKDKDKRPPMSEVAQQLGELARAAGSSSRERSGLQKVASARSQPRSGAAYNLGEAPTDPAEGQRHTGQPTRRGLSIGLVGIGIAALIGLFVYAKTFSAATHPPIPDLATVTSHQSQSVDGGTPAINQNSPGKEWVAPARPSPPRQAPRPNSGRPTSHPAPAETTPAASHPEEMFKPVR